MLQKATFGRYSSVIDLQLVMADGQIYPLSQIGPDFVILETPRLLSPGSATIVMTLDGQERHTHVNLRPTAETSDLIHTEPA
jgi:hypothetical protein